MLIGCIPYSVFRLRAKSIVCRSGALLDVELSIVRLMRGARRTSDL